MCVACASAALAAEEFRLFVQNANALWRRALNNMQQLSEECADNTTSVCAFMSQKDVNIDIFKDSDGGNAQDVLKRSKAKMKKKYERKQRVVRTGPMTSCPDCHKCFSNPHLLQQHLRNSDMKDACLKCGIVLQRGAEMQKHLRVSHNENWLLCSLCPVLLPTEADLQKHEKNAHKSGVLSCNACGKTFTRRAGYDKHVELHVVFTCRRCGFQFTNRSCFREHRMICEPNAKPPPETVDRIRRSNNRDPGQFTCDYCQKVYSSRSQLANHILWIHMDHRPHQCSWCGKRFYTAGRLTEHSVVHTRERKFECDICGIKLVSKSAAVYHRRRHTGEKPYVCNDCGASFITASRRLEHEKRKHNKGVRFQCVECPASFVRKRELEKHVSKHHKAVPSILHDRLTCAP